MIGQGNKWVWNNNMSWTRSHNLIELWLDPVPGPRDLNFVFVLSA
jgi:hypothetical protein